MNVFIYKCIYLYTHKETEIRITDYPTDKYIYIYKYVYRCTAYICEAEHLNEALYMIALNINT